MPTRGIPIMLLAALGLAQQQSNDVVFKSTSNLVVLDVTVRDKSGKEIPDLRNEDFTVLEDGKPQSISVFEFQRLSTDPAAEPPKPSIVKAAPQRQATITTAAKGKVQYQDRRLVVMLFDFTSMPVPDQIRAKDAAAKFIREKMAPTDLVSIMTFSAALKVEQDFTDDRDRLEEVIKGFRIGESS